MPQVAGGSVTFRHRRIGQGVAQVIGQVEIALLRDSDGVGDGLRVLLEDFLHLLRRLQAEVMVGPDVGQGLLDGGVAPGSSQRVLQAAALRAMVVNVVGGNQGSTGTSGHRRRFPVALIFSFQKAPLQFHVHSLRAVPLPVVAQQPESILPGEPALSNLDSGPSRPPVSSDHAPGVFRQMHRVQPGFAAVGGVGQGEQAGDVGVALAGLRQQDQAGPVLQGQLAAGDGLDAHAVGQPGELQGAAQVSVGQGQGIVTVLPGLGQQLVNVGGARIPKE